MKMIDENDIFFNSEILNMEPEVFDEIINITVDSIRDYNFKDNWFTILSKIKEDKGYMEDILSRVIADIFTNILNNRPMLEEIFEKNNTLRCNISKKKSDFNLYLDIDNIDYNDLCFEKLTNRDNCVREFYMYYTINNYEYDEEEDDYYFVPYVKGKFTLFIEIYQGYEDDDMINVKYLYNDSQFFNNYLYDDVLNDEESLLDESKIIATILDSIDYTKIDEIRYAEKEMK